ncbi:MAG: DUF5667 domain-containing protein [Candidatus Nanohaloarchaea archaeon]
MKNRTLAIVFSVLVLAGTAAAQTQEIQASPGWVTPDSALYGLEVAVDNTAMSIGIASPGGIAVERAAEVRAMARQNKTQSMKRALNQLNKVAKRAKSGDAKGLAKARQVLQQVKSRVPQEAMKGISTAMKNIRRAQERIPGDVPAFAGGNGTAPGPGSTPGPGGPNGTTPGPGGTNRTAQEPDTGTGAGAGNQTMEDGAGGTGGNSSDNPKRISPQS